MSHELHFLAPTPLVWSIDRFLEWCRGREHFIMPADPSKESVWYRNTETGVYAQFALEANRGVPSPVPDDLRWAGVSVILNYVRPSFFALEVMPIVEALADELGLLVDDAQAGQTAVRARAFQLVASWNDGNRAAIEALMKQGHEIFTLDPRRSTAWWNYMREKPTLERTWSKQVYVPGVFLVVPEGTTQVLRLLSWAEGVPLILPECDLVVIVKSSRSGQMTPAGVIDYTELATRLTPYLQPLDGPAAEARLLPPARAAAGRAVWTELQPRAVRLDKLQRLRSDQFVDVDTPLSD